MRNVSFLPKIILPLAFGSYRKITQLFQGIDVASKYSADELKFSVSKYSIKLGCIFSYENLYFTISTR